MTDLSAPRPTVPPAAGPTPDRIADLCRAAQDFVQRTLGVAVDTSEESLAFLDHYVTQVRSDAQRKGEVLGLVSAALGAHLGQVALQRFGGVWEVVAGAADADQPAAWRVTLSAAPLTFAPIGMAAEALMGAEAPGYEATITTTLQRTAALTAALSRLPPVSEEYYYSLTGRLETVSYAVDVLVELARQAEVQQAPAAGEADDDAGDDDDTSLQRN